MKQHRLAAFGMAVLLGFAVQGVSPLRAAEPWSAAQPTSPRALAQHVRSLTEGGLFDPGEASLADTGPTLFFGQAFDGPSRILFDPDQP